MNDLLHSVLGLIPERFRVAISAALTALVALQVMVSVVVQALPSSATRDPRWGGVLRALHRFGHMRFADELGTLKLPGAAALRDPRDTTIAVQRARIAALEAQLDVGERPLSRDTIAPPPIDPELQRARGDASATSPPPKGEP